MTDKGLEDTVRLTHLALELLEAGYEPGPVAPTYRRIIQRVNDGTLPVVRFNNRYFPRRSDFPEIACLLGMTPPTGTSAHHNTAIAA